MSEVKARIEKNLEGILSNMRTAAEKAGRGPDSIILLPVTKKRSIEQIQALIDLGYNTFGESYTEEIVERFQQFPDVNWHFIGHLHRKHTNKIVGNVKLIHSIANQKLLEKVNFTAGEKGIVQDVLLEVNVSGEGVKQGFRPNDVTKLFEEKVPKGLQNVRIKGLMTMAPHTDDEVIIHTTFSGLTQLLEELNKTYNANMSELSMGMTNDYMVAVEEGATIVRIGTAIYV